MATVPTIPGGAGNDSSSPLLNPDNRPSESQLLMSAATMHSMGRLTDPQRSAPTGGDQRPNPSKPFKSKRRFKVVK